MAQAPPVPTCQMGRVASRASRGKGRSRRPSRPKGLEWEVDAGCSLGDSRPPGGRRRVAGPGPPPAHVREERAVAGLLSTPSPWPPRPPPCVCSGDPPRGPPCRSSCPRTARSSARCDLGRRPAVGGPSPAEPRLRPAVSSAFRSSSITSHHRRPMTRSPDFFFFLPVFVQKSWCEDLYFSIVLRIPVLR